MCRQDSTISGKDLASLMGVSPEVYLEVKPIKGGHSFLHPYNLLTEGIVKGFPNTITKVDEGKYRTGEIWEDKFYEIVYLYVEKDSQGKDITIILGGDTFDAGGLEQGIINSGDQGRIFFDRKLFPI